MEIRSTEVCTVEIRYTEGCRSTGPHKQRGTSKNYNIQKDVYLWKALDIPKNVKKTELVLKLLSDSSTGFM